MSIDIFFRKIPKLALEPPALEPPTAVNVYGVTHAGASCGDNIEKFRPPLNRENHEKPQKNAVFFQIFMNGSRAKVGRRF